jgi:hypothetical protein
MPSFWRDVLCCNHELGTADRVRRRAGGGTVEREGARLLVAVADDVDHVSVRGAHEESADAPGFIG